MKLPELAEKITEHLERFEADPSINIPRKMGRDTIHYYQARAYPAGRYVGIVYVCYQSASNLTKTEATAYLGWLDAGNVGKHFKFQQLSNAADGASA